MRSYSHHAAEKRGIARLGWSTLADDPCEFLAGRDRALSLADALVTAGRRRVRPILMTTLATLFGLLPLALGIGSGAEIQKPLALAVIGGLLLSTFITAFVMPIIYSMLKRDQDRS
jgi:HAE1 family hydrophobic/amphiphilic exporter-1